MENGVEPAIADPTTVSVNRSLGDRDEALLETPIPEVHPDCAVNPKEGTAIADLLGNGGDGSGRGAYIANSTEPSQEPETEIEPEPGPEIIKITISAAGDVTLGGDARQSGYRAFLNVLESSDNDHGVFLMNVMPVFGTDDLTIVNLEGALTDSMQHLGKTFAFRGPPHYARILSSSSVEAVTLANNHSGDYRENGYLDTVASLEAENVAYFGNEFNTILEIKGIKVGLFGYLVWNDGQSNRDRILGSIEDLRDRGAELIIAYYHWGAEYVNTPSVYQRRLGQFSIDNGADLVLGSHPHVIQGIEEYNGKNIVYSLGNFCFAGNMNPRDQDTFIFRQTFTFEDGVKLDINDSEIIPARISSVPQRNDFQPILAEGEDGGRISGRISSYSSRLNTR